MRAPLLRGAARASDQVTRQTAWVIPHVRAVPPRLPVGQPRSRLRHDPSLLGRARPVRRQLRGSPVPAPSARSRRPCATVTFHRPGRESECENTVRLVPRAARPGVRHGANPATVRRTARRGSRVLRGQRVHGLAARPASAPWRYTAGVAIYPRFFGSRHIAVTSSSRFTDVTVTVLALSSTVPVTSTRKPTSSLTAGWPSIL